MLRVLRAEFGHDALDLRYDITGFEYDDRITYPDVFAGDFVRVVQAGMLHGGTRHDDGIKHGNRRCGARTSDTDHDVLDDRRRLLCGVFVRDRSSWLFADDT